MITGVQRYQPGALVRSRERDWVVIPQEDDGVIRLRPVDGSDEEAIGVFLSGAERGRQLQLALTDPKVSSFHAEWERAAD